MPCKMEEPGAERVNDVLQKQSMFHFALLLVLLFPVSAGGWFSLFVTVKYCFRLYSPIGETFRAVLCIGVWRHFWPHIPIPALTQGNTGCGPNIPKGDEREAMTSLLLTLLYGAENCFSLVGLRHNIHKWSDPFQNALLIGKSQTQNGGLDQCLKFNMLSGHSVTLSCCLGGTLESTTNGRGSSALYSAAVFRKRIFEAHLQVLDSL